MPNYLKEALHKFQHPKPPLPQNALHAWISPNYGAKIQYDNGANHSPLLTLKSTPLVQQIVRIIIYYAITIDPNILVALCTLSYQQYKATERTYDVTLWLLNYTDSKPDTTI